MSATSVERRTAPGTLVGDKYEIVGQIGRGGMSVVWLARDVRLRKLWAVKEVRACDGGEREALLRASILDEANFMKRLDHPAIPRVVDIIDTGPALYVVMDYVDGQSLSRLLAERGRPFSQEEVVRWGIELCDVLEYLHGYTTPEGERHQIVYRDLKPANVMLRDDGRVRLIDFGVCWERVGGLNNDGRIVGTPGYAPPEQLPHGSRQTRLDEDVVIDERADIYALGATLYSLVTGHVPKVVRDAKGHRDVSFVIRPIRSFDASLSEGLERVLLTATQEDRGMRYGSLAEMRYDLEHHTELTRAHRLALEGKVRGLRRRVAATLCCVACGLACLALGSFAQSRSHDALMRAASIASVDPAAAQAASDAEVLYTRAIAADPSRVEPYVALVRDVYEADNVFAPEEETRFNEVFRANEAAIRDEAGYASLCFDAGVCHLCFLGADATAADGSTQGQGALLNAGKARPWFERVCTACEVRRVADADGHVEVLFDKGGQDIDDADVLAADVYLRIAEFNELKQRAAREGRSAGETYQDFWEALRSAVRTSGPYAEGVRLRLYQMAFEALAADDVMGGIYRKALEDGRVAESRAEAEELLDEVLALAGSDELRRFAEAPGNADMYEAVLAQIVGGEQAARNNIARTYDNPVARSERMGAGERGEA